MAWWDWSAGGSWSLLDDLQEIQDQLNRQFEDWVPGGTGRRYPPLNAWVSDQDIVVDVELPGVDPKKVDISVVGSTLTLSGRREREDLKEGETYHRTERRHGNFARTVELPFRVEAGAVKATCRNGILRLTLPRMEADKPRKIAIEAA
jgi:HSP20 family protein